MKTRLLVVLQNAYDKGQLKQGWHPGRWKTEFLKSRTGFRLKMALPGTLYGRLYPWSVHYTNACPGIGNGPDSQLEPCEKHLGRALRRVDPMIVLACGKVAEGLCTKLWAGPLIVMPHPASRVITDNLLVQVASCLVDWRILLETPGWRRLACDVARLRPQLCGFQALVALDVPRLKLVQGRGEVRLIDLGSHD